MACGQQKVKGGHGSIPASNSTSIIALISTSIHCIDHHPEPRSGLCPELLADFRIPKPPGRSQGAQRAVFCAVRVADFLAEGAGWGASPGRGGELGCLRAEKKGNNKSLSEQLEGRAPFRASNSPSSPVASNPKATLKKQERAIPRRGRSVRQVPLWHRPERPAKCNGSRYA